MHQSRADLNKDILIQFPLRGRILTLRSTWGLFSPDKVDAGSALLLENVHPPATGDILDLGCGYGVLGIALATLAPQCTVQLVDKDFVAVEYTNKNIAENGLVNARAYLSNGFSHVPAEQKFDLVVSNLPAKVGRELYDVFFYDAHKALKPGGALVVVTIAGLKDAVKRSLKEIFGNFKKLAHSNTYLVSQAERSS